MQTKSNYIMKALRNGILLLGCFAMFYSASSAAFYTGGGKKNNTKTAPASLTFKGKNSLSLSNGFRYKPGLSFSQSNKNTLMMSNNVVRYQRGNNLYVLPVKQKVIFTKFKTPQKDIR
jgi:hypothetical protein